VSRFLAIFADPNAALADSIPRPTLGQVMYAQANTDRSRKFCGNCLLWCADDENCVVHDPDTVAPQDACCAYHVFGPPIVAVHPAPDRAAFIRPEFSGLAQVGSGGRVCDRCTFYQPRNGSEGTCAAVQDITATADAVVEALASCARWESVDG
jgi:hypothetical protein